MKINWLITLVIWTITLIIDLVFLFGNSESKPCRCAKMCRVAYIYIVVIYCAYLAIIYFVSSSRELNLLLKGLILKFLCINSIFCLDNP